MDGKNYSAVPPPPSLTAPSKDAAPLNFSDALSKARAIAEKLKQQSSGGTVSVTTSGSKRSYYDDDRDDSRSSYSSSRSYGSHQADRDSKRSAYESETSRPSYNSSNESRRYGLGSEERKSSYGGSHHSQHQEEYSVPNHMVGLLIGKGGENLKKIERVSGVHKVQFANDPVGNERPVYLSGEPDQVAIARDMIRQMVSDASANDQNRFSGGSSRYSDHSEATGGNTLTIRIPMNKVGLVIGRGGETIRDFEERSKAKILIASDSAGDRDTERVINLVGDDAAVQYAKSLIEDIVNGNNNTGGRSWGQQTSGYGNGYDQQGGYSQGSYGQGRMGRPDDERIFITVPASVVGLIIGRGGETVRAMQDQSGARVKVDPSSDPNSDERTVNISGDPKCVAIAKQLVEEKVAEASGGRGGRYGGYNNHDGYNGRGGGYKSQNQDYGNDYSQQGGYQGSNEGGYDYSQQYSQYYAQYGYDQSQYNNGESGYQQYPGYQYNYQQGEYDEQVPGTDSAHEAPPPPANEQNGDDTSNENASADKKDETTSKSKSDQSLDQSAYYARYYGGQQPTPEQQQAYYQWYQQYYGQQQPQEPYKSYDQQQEGDMDKHNNPETENVDGEPLDNDEKEVECKKDVNAPN